MSSRNIDALLNSIVSEGDTARKSLAELGEALEHEAGISAELRPHGRAAKSKFQELSVVVNNLSFKAAVQGGRTHYYVADVVRGIALSHKEVDVIGWVRAMRISLAGGSLDPVGGIGAGSGAKRCENCGALADGVDVECPYCHNPVRRIF